MSDLDLSYLLNSVILVVSLAATFLSANMKIKKIWKIVFLYTSLICLALVYWIINIFSGEKGTKLNLSLFWTNSIAMFVLLLILSFFILKDKVVSKKKVNKMIINFTKQVKTYNTINMFGGDLSFLEDVADGSINKNEQFIQLKGLNQNKSCDIKILCFYPKNDKSKIRLGFLLENLNNTYIKFYVERKCNNCGSTDKCNKCWNNPEHECIRCKSCNETHRCNNPDLDIRGRIISDSNGLEHIFLTNVIENGKTYAEPLQLDRTSKEGLLYIKLWDLWWDKCETDNEMLTACKDMYRKHVGGKALAERY